MIQRKQTLFLLQAIFCNVALLFIPFQKLISDTQTFNLSLMPGGEAMALTAGGYMGAVILNIITLVLALLIAFLYSNRNLQIRLTYVLMALWVVLGGCMLLCPMTANSANIKNTEANYFFVAICVFALLAGWLAIRNIKKDIELLKSADRIR